MNPAHIGRFKTGARPTPRWILARATPHAIKRSPPKQVIFVPSFLEAWLNDTYGDCVTAEEAAAKAYFSVMCGLPETRITDATVKAFASKFGFLEGANLSEVMDKMISDGFQQDAGYKDGPYKKVDFTDDGVLQSALANGPVKISIDSSALPSGAGNGSGWYDFGGGVSSNQDHCVGLWNYGPADAMFDSLKTPVPSNAPASGILYGLYTWATIGIVDRAWIDATVGEAWLRNPTTLGVNPVTPPLDWLI